MPASAPRLDGAQQSVQRLSFSAGQRAQDFVLDTLQGAVSTLERPPAGQGELDDVTPSVGLITAPLGESATFEHIQ